MPDTDPALSWPDAATHDRWMTTSDYCPTCRGDAGAPLDAHPCPGGFLAVYRCRTCRHRWTTTWWGLG